MKNKKGWVSGIQIILGLNKNWNSDTEHMINNYSLSKKCKKDRILRRSGRPTFKKYFP